MMKPLGEMNSGKARGSSLAGAVLAALVGLSAAWSPAVAQSPFTVPVQVDTLANGLTIILAPYDTPGVVAYWTVVRAGSRNEVEPGRTGYAHLFEHMMFRGTRKYPKEELSRMIALMGAEHSAFTDHDWTVYTSTLPAPELHRMIELQADRFINLAYDEEAYAKETGAVLGEFNIGRAEPGTLIEEKLLETAFERHTYRHTVMGFEADVRGMPEGYDYS
ncbi:MAG: insulinase family protein, partial [Candidatus Eisenbacteria bacterium]|nr:insulinase family protein [Candidatus Eisenbacteria bacterium]